MTANRTTNWSDVVEDDQDVFGSSSIIVRTPVTTRCTLNDVELAPKKEQATTSLKPKSRDAPPPADAIEALAMVQKILLQKTIKSEQKTDAIQYIESAIQQFVTMSEKLERYKQRQENKPTNVTDGNTRLSNIEKELASIKKTLTRPAHTYADVTQGTCQHQHAAVINKIKAEKRKKESAKYEILLTANKVTEEIKKALNIMHSKNIINRLNKAVEAPDVTKPDVKPAVKGINKLFNNTFRLHCETENDAAALRKTE